MVEGAPHTAKNMITWINLCLGVPLPPYIKEQGEVRPARRRARQEESYSHRE